MLEKRPGVPLADPLCPAAEQPSPFCRGGAPPSIRAMQAEQEGNQMLIVLLKFSANKGQAGQFMEGHKAWIKRGFDDGVFLLMGNLQPNLGGGIVAHNTSLADLQSRVNADPFVMQNVVSAEILEITPSRADERLQFLLD
jgi:uncharacterized protein YciI